MVRYLEGYFPNSLELMATMYASVVHPCLCNGFLWSQIIAKTLPG